MVKMTSFELITQPSASDTSNGEESSDFIVLPGVPSPASSLHGPPLSIGGGFQMNVMSASSDLTPEELNGWLKELICGNVALKDALQRSNTVMHEQVSRFTLWLDQMRQTNSAHLAMLEEAKQTILNLQEENERLRKQNEKESMPLTAPSADSCVQCSILEKKVLAQQEELNMLEQAKKNLSCELAKQQHVQQQLEQSIESISHNLGSLQSNSKTLETEKRELTALNNQLITQLSNLSVGQKRGTQEATIFCDDESGYAIVLPPDVPVTGKAFDRDSLKGALLELHEERHKVGELTQELVEERAQVACLKKLLEEKNSQMDKLSAQTCVKSTTLMPCEAAKVSPQSCSYQTADNFSLCQEIETSHPKYQLAASYAQKYKERCDSLQLHMEEYQDKLQKLQASDNIVIDQLRQEVKNLQTILREVQIAYQEDKKNLMEANHNLEEMKRDYNIVLDLLKTQAEEQRTKNAELDDAKGKEHRLHLEQLDFLTAKLMNTQQQLEAEEQKVAVLKNELSKVEKDTENIPILKAQVELYKSDFENERVACESAKNEVEKLKKEVNSLKQELTSSHRDRENHAYAVSGSNTKIKKVKKMSKSSEESLGECPCCLAQYPKNRLLSEHVEQCLLQHGQEFV